MKGAHLLLAGLAALCIILLAAQAAHPVLWTAANATSTPAEADLSVAEKMNADRADSMMPLMQDILSQSGTIVLSVKVKDWESAQRDLEQYAAMTQSMSNLIVSLDLSETDIANFSAQSRENEETLRTLVNGTQRFDEIKQLQIEYRDKDDPSKLYSIIYEGEALQDELAQACTTYAGQEKVMSSIARKYDQNTTAYEESVDRYQEIVGEVAEVQQHEIGASAPALPPPAISIFLTPEEARYGEEIQVRGRLDTGKDGADTALYVDSRRYANTGTAGGGRYAFVYTVEKSRAGTHLVYVQSGRSVSDLAPFSVLSSPSALTLTAKANASAQTAVCTGTLTAAGRGVAGAEVTICADGNAAASTRTAENGAYETAIALEPGRHTLRAAFDAAGFPLEPSESDDAEVAITDPLGLMKAALTGLAAVAVGLIAGLIYLRRSQRPPAPKEAVETVAEPPPLPEPEPPGPAGPLTPIEEAVLLRERLALEAGKHCGLKNPRAKTPREIAAAFEGTAAEESARAFVRLYEAVRYAGMPCGDEEVGELRRLYGAAVGAL